MTTPSESSGSSSSNGSVRTEYADNNLHKIATRLEKEKKLYCVYGMLDGLANAYGVTKSVFDVSHYSESQIAALDDMHEWVSTPLGIGLSITNSLFLMSFALFGNLFTLDSKAKYHGIEYQKIVAYAWLYTRELIQALRNSFKGIRTLFFTLNLFASIDFRVYIIPSTLIFGLIYTLNRVFFLSAQASRKEKKKQNDLLYLSICENPQHNQTKLLPDQTVQFESASFRLGCILLKAYNGLIDSLYLLIGVVTLVPMSPHLLLIAGIFSAIYACICIATRAFEEYEAQRELLISQCKIKLLLAANSLKEEFKILQTIALNSLSTIENGSEAHKKIISSQIAIVEKKHHLFEYERQHLLQNINLSPTSRLLMGAHRGIAAYGALLSALFCSAILFTFAFGIMFPPALVFGCIAFGSVIILAFMAYTWHQTKPIPFTPSGIEASIYKIKEDQVHARELCFIEETKQSIHESMSFNPLPGSYLTDVIETIRSFFSAMIKGKKEIEFILNCYQKPDENGHYQDTPIITFLIAPVAVLYAIFFSLRALVKGYAKNKTTNPILPPSTPVVEKKLPIIPLTSSNPQTLFFDVNNSRRTTPDKKNPNDTNPTTLSSDPVPADNYFHSTQ